MSLWTEPALLPDISKGRFAIRAKYLMPMAGEKPAAGKELFEPARVLENPLILVEDGLIADLGSARGRLTAGYASIDLGDVCLTPPLVNAHTHLQLSWMEGLCAFGLGFGPWLEDLIKSLFQVLTNQSEWTEEKRRDKYRLALQNLKNCGVHYIGDIGGSVPGAITALNELAGNNFQLYNFCEWFGFRHDPAEFRETWPKRCRKELTESAWLRRRSAPCGHALYSTSLAILQEVKRWQAANGGVFTMHLAESLEEEQCLGEGRGKIWEIYRDNVLPPDWKPFKKRPYEIAKSAGLVDGRSLLVHCVHLNNNELKDLAERGAAVCLCPRSNANLGVGEAPVRAFIENRVRLCLGTDGLSSNRDLNVLNEALYLMETMDLPFRCVLRLCTVNGADALGAAPPWVRPGSPGRFGAIPASRVF